ncbi:MAG: thioredoxin fold domain-containing protein [Rhizobacter sp.]|nr:thioredoxin fold domain-containing protein [Rhizobacter sp.]
MKLHVATRMVPLCLAALLVACSKPAEPPVPAAPLAPVLTAAPKGQAAQDGIAWKHVTSDAEVDAAFALARQEVKPVFVYWGASWCPPCNQVKSTIFNRLDFIERSRAFVPVYVDGDSPGAQRLGNRFNVRGYPTMVLFSPQGAELTRLPGEVDGEQYAQVLTLGMNAQRPVKAVLADVQAGAGRAGVLTPNDWKLLAFYSWETDEQQLVAKDAVPALLRQLAEACPADQAQTANRLLLKALAAVPENSRAAPDATSRDKLQGLLADPGLARPHLDVLSNNAAAIARALSAPDTPERASLLQALDGTLQRFTGDTSLSRADRMAAAIARVDLARIDARRNAAVKLPESLLAAVREQAARADREITDGYERQAVVTAAAYLLERAGLSEESDALLKANLAKSHSPYYLMSALAGNARNRGQTDEALRWYEQAFDKSVGPATRLQWGASYISALIEMAPTDEARIEKAVQQLFSEAGAQPDAFFERSGRSLQRVGKKLLSWNQDGMVAEPFKRLQDQLDAVCRKLDGADPQRQTCEGLLKPAPGRQL